MEIIFIPSPDVAAVLNTLLDIFERRSQHAIRQNGHETRSIKVTLNELALPAYFSQTDPQPRLIANDQFTQLEQAGLLTLTRLPGEKGNLLQSVALKKEGAPYHTEVNRTPSRSTAEWSESNTSHPSIYALLDREPAFVTRSRLETTMLADKFRFPKDDWRTRAIHWTLAKLRAGKSPAPFSLTDSSWNFDLLTVLSALSGLETETPYRVFSIHASNPNYIHMAGNWQFTTQSGEILSLGGFTPSVGFPAAQIDIIQSVSIHVDSVLCIENLTSLHEFIRARNTDNSQYAIICLMGNPSPHFHLRKICSSLPPPDADGYSKSQTSIHPDGIG